MFLCAVRGVPKLSPGVVQTLPWGVKLSRIRVKTFPWGSENFPSGSEIPPRLVKNPPRGAGPAPRRGLNFDAGGQDFHAGRAKFPVARCGCPFGRSGNAPSQVGFFTAAGPSSPSSLVLTAPLHPTNTLPHAPSKLHCTSSPHRPPPPPHEQLPPEARPSWHSCASCNLRNFPYGTE